MEERKAKGLGAQELVILEKQVFFSSEPGTGSEVWSVGPEGGLVSAVIQYRLLRLMNMGLNEVCLATGA